MARWVARCGAPRTAPSTCRDALSSLKSTSYPSPPGGVRKAAGEATLGGRQSAAAASLRPPSGRGSPLRPRGLLRTGGPLERWVAAWVAASQAQGRWRHRAGGGCTGCCALRLADGNYGEEREVRCGAVRCGAVRCGAVRCGAVRCGAVRCGAVRGNARSLENGQSGALARQQGRCRLVGTCFMNVLRCHRRPRCSSATQARPSRAPELRACSHV